MALSKDKKKKTIDTLKEKIEKQKSVVFVDFTGLKVKDMSELRKRVRGAEGELKAAKKTLMGIAFKDSKLEISTKDMPGELAMIVSYKDEVAPVKLVWQFSTENQNLKILGGILENGFIGPEKVIELAQLPSKDELLAKMVGSISSPISGFVCVLNGNLRGLVQVIDQISKTKV